MKHLLLIVALTLGAGCQALADLNNRLVNEIRAWKKGSPPPARLLKFPDGKIDTTLRCDMRVRGDAVEDYIGEIKNTDLLAALLFDPHVENKSFRAAAEQLVHLIGTHDVAHLLAEKRKSAPAIFVRPELAILTQLLQSPYAVVKVAHIARADMKPQLAKRVLLRMGSELEAGKTWRAVYLIERYFDGAAAPLERRGRIR